MNPVVALIGGIMKRGVGIFLMCITALCLAGCKVARFAYKPLEQGAQKLVYPLDGASIYVDVISDPRIDKTSTEGWSLLALLPLVPFMPYHNYDMQTYSGDVGDIEFNACHELRCAMVEHFNYNGIKTIGRARADYILKPEIVSFGIDGVRTLYCCGLIPGCYLSALGLPNAYSTSHLEVNFVLSDKTGTEIFKKSYRSEDFYATGLYYNWNPLKYVGYNLANIMNRLSEDLVNLIP